MEKINGRKLSLIFIFILILLVIALLVGKFTFSYLGPTISDDLETQGEVTASGDTLIFTKGKTMSLSASTDNFATGGSNLSTTTNPKVKLIASTKTNEASATYYVGVLIKNNSYVYTTSGKTPELILTIKDEKGNNVTSGVDGLTYVTSGGVSGFDVTGKKGLFNIKMDYPISTTSSSAGTTHTWTFTLTFVNLGTDQSDNENASMNIDIYLQKTKILTLTDYVISQYTGTQGENGLYYHDSSLANGAGDNSYRYAGGDYVLTEAGKATGATMVIGYDNEITTALIDFYCNGTKQYVGYGSYMCNTYYYQIKEDATQYQSYNEVLNVSVEKGYLTKDNVKNFVCFGSDASPCPEANLFRIIGVFGDQTKVIRAKSVGYQSWDTNGLNTWSTSSLNTYLNGEYLTSLGALADKIATTTWKVGGGSFTNIQTSIPTTAYQYEVGANASTTTHDAQIGLMYVTDYYYSASPSAWTLVGYNKSDATKDYRAAKTTNWLYLGFDEWTISRASDDVIYAFHVGRNGVVYDDDAAGRIVVRPSFNLESSVKYVSGSGSMSDPVRVN